LLRTYDTAEVRIRQKLKRYTQLEKLLNSKRKGIVTCKRREINDCRILTNREERK
jgi:hypothetical protein